MQKDNFIRIIEHPKSKLMEISLSVTTLVFIICLLYMFCGLLPSAKKNLALAGVSSNFASADFRKIKTYNFRKSESD